MNVRRMSPAGGQPTIEQVAARAGVGRGTVSRVINGSPQVTDRTREAVLRAIDELGYVPNRAARALVTQRTDTVALLISESEERIFGEPFFAGAKLNVVDIKLHMAVRWFIGGKVDHIPATIFSGFPNLMRVHDAVRDHAGVQAWNAKSAAARAQ